MSKVRFISRDAAWRAFAPPGAAKPRSKGNFATEAAANAWLEERAAASVACTTATAPSDLAPAVVAAAPSNFAAAVASAAAAAARSGAAIASEARVGGA